jgi:hypothetical protein
MVLIGRQGIFAELRKDQALAALITILFEPDGSIAAPHRISQTADAVIASLSSVMQGIDAGFRESVTMLLRRKISTSAEWVHDDLLAFSMVVGNLRFGGSDEFIQNILEARLTASDDLSLQISRSLEALSQDRNEAPFAGILVVGKILAFPASEIHGELLANAYKQSVAMETKPTTKQFLRLIGEKIADIATSVGGIQNASDYSRLKTFQSNFEVCANRFSRAVFILTLVGVVAVWVYIAKLYFSSDKAAEDLAGKLFQMGVIVPPVLILIGRQKISASLRRMFYRFFGGGELLKD